MSKVTRCILNQHTKCCRKLLAPRWRVVCSKANIYSPAKEVPSDVATRCLGQPTAFTHPNLIKEDEVTPGLMKLDYLQRRLQLMSKIASESLPDNNEHSWQSEKEEHVLILPSAPISYMTQDIPYPFHQNNDFLYLSGFMEPDSCLVLESVQGKPMPDHQSTLFVRKRDPVQELWNGARSGHDGALYHTGVDETAEIENLSEYLKKFQNSKYIVWYEYNKMTNLQMHMQHISPFLTEVTRNKQRIRLISNPINEQRLIKSEKEILLMAMAAEITAAAFKETMSMCYVGMNEQAINARLEYASKVRGADMLAYPPVVAAGNRANTLHYISNNQTIVDNSLVLVDAGAHYHGYTCDVTRTWPINGKYSDTQKALYEAVLKVQRHCIQMCQPGETLDNIYNVMTLMLAHELFTIGVITQKLTPNELVGVIRRLCPHHVGHWLGMDLHDTPSVARNIPMRAGMVLTIEPGIYLRDDDMTIRSEFRGIGIRIEDDVLVQSEGPPHVLTKSCPKSVEDIEHVMARK